jgi:hypothetical protein
VGGAPDNPLLWPEVTDSGATATWNPGASTNSPVPPLTSLPASGPMSGRVFTTAPSHVLWSTCQGATPFDWRPPNGPSGGSASPACDCTGTQAASFAGTTFKYDPATAGSVPAAVYFIAGNSTFSTTGMGLPGTDANEADWPQATFLVDGNVTFSGQGRIGIGTAKGTAVDPPLPAAPVVPAIGYPSLVVSGNLTVGAGASWAYGGAVWVRGNATYGNGSNVELYGPLTVGGNLTVGTGGKLDVVVSTPMVDSLKSPVAVAATGSRTLR